MTARRDLPAASGLPGLPGPLPKGERLLWQGAPSPSVLLRRVFHLRGLTLYFAAILAWTAAASAAGGAAAAEILPATLRLALAAAVPLALIGIYAVLTGRSTVYTVTDRRVAMHFGLALPMTVNLPLRRIEAASLKLHRDGSGDLALRPAGCHDLSYFVLWPHARPWRLARAEPTLQAIPDAARVASLLAEALAAATAVRVPVTEDAPETDDIRPPAATADAAA